VKDRYSLELLIEHNFRYHAPTETTRPLYAQVREAEGKLREVVHLLERGDFEKHVTFDAINEACKAYALALLGAIPEGADAEPCILQVGLCRNLINEALASRKRDADRDRKERVHPAAVLWNSESSDLLKHARTRVLETRMAACKLIALHYAARDRAAGIRST